MGTEPQKRDDDPLIEALAQITKLYIGGAKRLLRAAKASDAEIRLGANALGLILNRTTRSLSPERRGQLAGFLYRTPLGRAVGALRFKEPPAADQLTRKLLGTDDPHARVDPSISGRYFVYHASISHAEHYSIRAMEIRSEDDFVFSVYDHFIEDASGTKQERPAIGIVIKTRIGHQIITLNEHRASGLQVITVEDVVVTNENGGDDSIRKYAVLNGNMFGSEADGTHFYVGVRMVRNENDPLTAMTERTGAFSLEALNGPLMVEHRRQFQLLVDYPMVQRHRTSLERLKDRKAP